MSVYLTLHVPQVRHKIETISAIQKICYAEFKVNNEVCTGPSIAYNIRPRLLTLNFLNRKAFRANKRSTLPDRQIKKGPCPQVQGGVLQVKMATIVQKILANSPVKLNTTSVGKELIGCRAALAKSMLHLPCISGSTARCSPTRLVLWSVLSPGLEMRIS